MPTPATLRCKSKMGRYLGFSKNVWQMTHFSKYGLSRCVKRSGTLAFTPSSFSRFAHSDVTADDFDRQAALKSSPSAEVRFRIQRILKSDLGTIVPELHVNKVARNCYVAICSQNRKIPHRLRRSRITGTRDYIFRRCASTTTSRMHRLSSSFLLSWRQT